MARRSHDLLQLHLLASPSSSSLFWQPQSKCADIAPVFRAWNAGRPSATANLILTTFSQNFRAGSTKIHLEQLGFDSERIVAHSQVPWCGRHAVFEILRHKVLARYNDAWPGRKLHTFSPT